MNPLELVFGSKPEVAPWKNIKLTEQQKKSLFGNIENFGLISDLGNLYRQYFIDQTESQLPGYAETLATGQAGAQDILTRGREYLTGEIPKDVQEQIQRSSAYKSFSGGYAGSGMASGLTARDLGLTSLDLIGRGAQMVGLGGNSAQQWANLARGNVMNPSSMMVSPMDQANFTLQNQVLAQQAKQYAYNVEAAPDPAAKGISDTIMGLIGAYMGAGRGGGGSGITQPYPNTAPPNYGASYIPADTNVPWWASAQQGMGW